MVPPSNPFDFSEYTDPRHGSGGSSYPGSNGPVGAGPDPWAGAAATGFGPPTFGPPKQPEQGRQQHVFGGNPQPADTIVLGRPPVVWLAVAGVVALVGAVLAIVAGGSAAFAVVAWLLAGPAAIGVLAVYTVLDTQQRALPVYAQPTWTRAAYGGVLAVAAVGILISAWFIADWIGRL